MKNVLTFCHNFEDSHWYTLLILFFAAFIIYSEEYSHLA